MRLTLRTLLAYLDDTLPASEAKSMGEKLAESESAQEIVERIKNVIRRRRLTVPPASSRIDPNTVAEYLDNEITPELAEELERVCLASDVHLAEVAACHQILSLVVGEASAAPEDVIKRMYALGKGSPHVTAKRPAKAAAPTDKAASVDRDTDETLRMGLPSIFGRDSASRIMIFAGAGLALLLLVVAIFQLLQKPPATADKGGGTEQVAKVDLGKKTDEPVVAEIIKVMPKLDGLDGKKAVVTPEVKVAPPPEKDPKTPIDDLPPPVFTIETNQQRTDAVLAKLEFGPPSTKVVPLAQLLEPAKDQTSIVVQQIPKTSEWKRLASKQADLLSARPLVSLPGSKATLVTKKGVRLTLWGSIPDQLPAPLVPESIVELYDHETLDLDMTLHRGRVLIGNARDEPIAVRVRFENPSEPGGPEAYLLLTLTGKNAEIVVDRWSLIPYGEPFFKAKDDPQRKGPLAHVACTVMSGTVHLKTATESATLEAPPGKCLAVWSSATKKIETISMKALPPWLDAKAATPLEFLKVRAELNNAFTGKAVDVGLAELMKSNDVLTRRTTVRSLGAIDDLPGLFDALNQDKNDQRHAAVEALANWIGTSRDNEYTLYELLRARLKVIDADRVMTLLHGFSQQDAARAETYEWLIENLRHNQIAIRELAAWNLYRMVPAASNIPYDAGDAAKRDRGYKMWLNLIPPGKLPPAPKGKAAQEPRGERPNVAVRWVAPRAETLSAVEVELPPYAAASGSNRYFPWQSILGDIEP